MICTGKLTVKLPV